MLSALAAATTSASTAAKGGGSGFPSILFFLVLAFGAMWLIVIRPQRRKQKMQQTMQTELAVGDEVLTAGGVYGTVTHVADDEVRVEIAPNVEIRLARRAIAAQLTEHAPAGTAGTGEPEPDESRWQSAFDSESGDEKPG